MCCRSARPMRDGGKGRRKRRAFAKSTGPGRRSAGGARASPLRGRAGLAGGFAVCPGGPPARAVIAAAGDRREFFSFASQLFLSEDARRFQANGFEKRIAQKDRQSPRIAGLFKSVFACAGASGWSAPSKKTMSFTPEPLPLFSVVGRLPCDACRDGAAFWPGSRSAAGARLCRKRRRSAGERPDGGAAEGGRAAKGDRE